MDHAIIEVGAFLLLMGLILVLAGCSGEGSKLDRLDQNRGFGPYVLGDSMYSQVAQAASDSLTSRFGSEMEVLGHVVSTRVPVTFGRRFNFGTETTQ